MLGQAQECMCTAAINKGMKPNMIASLTQQVALYFDQALTLLSSPSIKETFEKSWGEIVALRKEVTSA